MNKRISFAATLLLCCLFSFSQHDSSAPYLRFPTVPPFKILKVDSMGYYTKADLKSKRPVLFILFNPDCEHCQHETEQIISRMEDFKKIQIVMATSMSFAAMKNFYQKYDIGRFDNIFMGQDFQYVLPSFFMIRNLPYLAMYDKKGKLLTTFEGTMSMDDILNKFKN
jgi:thiol-disulfide isomerase/thioredoxin